MSCGETIVITTPCEDCVCDTGLDVTDTDTDTDSPDTGDTDTDTPDTGDTDTDTDGADTGTLPPVTVTAGTATHRIESLALDLVEVTGGSFNMGCTEGQGDECGGDEVPVHSVVLTRSFLISVTEVTQAQYEALTGEQPSEDTDCGSNCPVETVTWHESALFANAVSAVEGLASCYTCTEASPAECTPIDDIIGCAGYRLPSEAEWEAASRCGTDLMYAGSDDDTEVAWTSLSSTATMHPVASLAPNGCGLFDMSGNVWEWVGDWYADYPDETVTDPLGPATGEARGYRGGGWGNKVAHARSANRHRRIPTFGFGILGLRIVRTLP